MTPPAIPCPSPASRRPRVQALSLATAAFMGILLAGCGGSDVPAAEASGGALNAEASSVAEGASARTPIPLDHPDPIDIRVYASPTCGCCSLWVEHLEENGFDVETVYREDMGVVKQSFGISDRLASCHTGIVNGYVVEGHVPAVDIRRLLAEAPGDVRGLAVPGMPIGSPGMEMGDRVDPYDVLTFRADGSTGVYASYGR
jgi:hypothetical protein